MNESSSLAEINSTSCKLLEVAKEKPGQTLDYKELDRPISQVIENNSLPERNIEVAKEKPGQTLDYKELDRPIEITDNLGQSVKSIENQEKGILVAESSVLSEAASLSDEEKSKIKEENGWTDEIIDKINSWDQYEIFRDADLHECEINGRECLIKELDFGYVDDNSGLTNKERMERGLSPIDSKTGDKIELHHMGQAFDSPLVELTEIEHGGKNHRILHDNSVESWRRNPELKNQYQNHERPEHWKTRANEGGI